MKQRSTAQKVLRIVFALIPLQTFVLGVVLFFIAIWCQLDYEYSRILIITGGSVVAESQLLWGIYDIIFSKKSIASSPLTLNILSICLGAGYFLFFSTTNPESMFYNLAPVYTIFCLLFPISAGISKLRKKLFGKQENTTEF